MPSSDITVAALTATPTLRGNKLAWTYSDPRSGAVPNIALDMVEVHASTTNDRTTASKVGEGITDFLHTGLFEEQTWYYWIKARNYLVHFGDWYPSGSTAGVSATAIGMSGLAFGLANGKIVATVGSNALTVAIKTAAGNDPSASDPVFVAFRNATLATGNYVIRQITAALSLTISSGSTLGANSGAPVRLWLAAFDDAGTVRLAAINCCSGFGVTPLIEYGGGSATAEGGAGAADSLGVFYASAAISAKRFRVFGFVEWTVIATAGAYVATPDVIHLAGIGTKFPGEIVQATSVYVSGQLSGVVAIPVDTSIPQSSEGVSVAAYSAFVPSSPANVIVTEFRVQQARSTAGPLIAAAFSSLSADALHTSIINGAADAIESNAGDYGYFAGNVTSRDYSVRAGASGGATHYVNSNAGGNYFGGTMTSKLAITEIMG